MWPKIRGLMMANLIEATKRLSALRQLPKGWDYGRGGPISQRAYRNGAMLIMLLAKLGASEFDIVPGDEDGAVIVAYRDNKSAEIHCLSDGRYDLLHEVDGGNEEFVPGLSIAALVFALEGFGWQSPRFYVSCIRNAMFRESDDTARSLFGTPRVVGFPSLVPIASQQMIANPASTFADSTTKTPAVTHQSSGEFRLLPYLEAVA